MSRKERIKSCCVYKCPNTELNCNVEFHSFPDYSVRWYQRKRWVQIIKSINGDSFLPDHWSRICSEHFHRGKPSNDNNDVDYLPSIFVTKKTEDNQTISLSVSIKKFALEYVKYDALLHPPFRANHINFSERKRALKSLSISFGIPVKTVRSWERRLKNYFERKMAETPLEKRKPKHWLTLVAKLLNSTDVPSHSAGSVVEALVSAARARRVLCSTALYNDVRRALRVSIAINDLHAVWVSAQRVALLQSAAAARAGDVSAPPAAAALVTDLLLLHTDVEAHRLLSDDSVSAYDESAALHTLWQLVMRHRLEEDAPPRERAERWSRAHEDYRASGRSVSLVVLQRRWHELKLQARERLAAHWRRAPAPPSPPAPPAPPLCPRPAPLHIAILKRYPHIATNEFVSWRQLVLDGVIVTEPLEEDKPKNTQARDEQQSSDAADLSDVSMAEQFYHNLSKVDEPIVDENDAEESETTDEQQPSDTTELSDQGAAERLYPNLSKVNDPVAEQLPGNDPLAEKRTVVETKIEVTESDLLFEQILVVDPLAEKRTAIEPKVEARDSDMLVEQSAVSDPLAENPASDPSCLGVPDAPREQVRSADGEAMSLKCTGSSDSDTDTEDNLVIDERSNNTASSIKCEPVAHTETHSTDTVSPLASPRNIAPTLEVLQMLDPSTVKTEILFESDEDDLQPCDEKVKVEIKLETKKQSSSISNRILFDDELPGPSTDVTEPMNCESEKKDDLDNDTPQIDPKLLMDTYVQLSKIDQCQAWKQHAHCNNSIKASLIHKEQHTSRQDESSTTRQEIEVDQSSLEEIAKTHSIRQLCSNIERELLNTQLNVLEGKTPNKKHKPNWNSDDDQPLLVLRDEKLSKETKDDREWTVEKKLEVESSSDEKLTIDETPSVRREKTRKRRRPRQNRLTRPPSLSHLWVFGGGEDNKKGRAGSHHAASTIEWSAAFAPAYGSAARRVRLPDIEQVRRRQRAATVAQVAPISAAVAVEEDATVAPTLQGDLLNEAPAEPRELELPAAGQLNAALEELATLSRVERVLQARAHCCAARRHRDVNDTRRRIGLPALPHTHADGVCTCCCAGTSDALVRSQLARQLRDLQQDVDRMLNKARRVRWRDSISMDKSTPSVKKRKQGGTVQVNTAQTSTEHANTAQASIAQVNTAQASTVQVNTMQVSTEHANTTQASTEHANTAQTSTVHAKSAQMRIAQANTAKSVCQANTAQVNAAQANTVAASNAQASNAQVNTAHATPRVTKKVSGPKAAPRSRRRVSSQHAEPAPLVDDYEEWQRQKTLNSQYFYINSATSSKGPSKKKKIEEKSAKGARVMSDVRVTAGPVPIAPRPPQNQRVIVARRPRASTEPQPVSKEKDNETKDKPLSILEEYARTLSAKSTSYCAVNTLRLQVPDTLLPRPQGPTTTILMAVTLPSENVIKTTTNRLCANDTVDLTTEEAPSPAPVIDLMHLVNSVNKTVMSSVFDDFDSVEPSTSGTVPPKAPRSKQLTLMSLSNRLRDGDVIEIDDTDSNHSSGSASNDYTIPINKTSNPAVYKNNSYNKNLSSNTNKSETTVITDKNTKQAGSSANSGREKAKSRQIDRFAKPKITSTSTEEAVAAHSVQRPCSRIPVLMSLTDWRGRCPGARPDLSALSGFMSALRKGVAATGPHLYYYNPKAVTQPVSELPCGGTLLCVDAARDPLLLPPRDQRDQRGPPGPRDHLVLTDADVPCDLPTYWTMMPYSFVQRIVLDDVEDVVNGSSARGQEDGGSAARGKRDDGSSARGQGDGGSLARRQGNGGAEKKQICQKKHQFKILTAFSSAAALRRALRAGASVLLLHVRRARVLVLRVQRQERAGRVRYSADADVHDELLRKLERLLDEAEDAERPGDESSANEQSAATSFDQ